MQEESGSRVERKPPKPECASIRRCNQSSEEDDLFVREDGDASASIDRPAFPTSRFPPVPLARPLELFGASFPVEVSSHLNLGPDTVLRAAIGKSLQTLLRDEGLLQPMKQLRYALLGRHKLTRTTRSTVLRALGPISASMASVLDGGPAPESLQSMSDWQCMAAARGTPSQDNLLDVILASFIKLDAFGEAIAALNAAGRREDAEAKLATRFSQTLPAWRQICPDLSLEGCFRIETSLLVLAEVGTIGSSGKTFPVERESVIASLLDPKAKPIGHWLRQVLAVTKCGDLRALSNLLERKQVRHQVQRPISHDTLKGWSAMKPGMLMSLEGCQSLLKVVAHKKSKDQLQARFALARFLAFLCDFLRASVRAEPPAWKDAQGMLLTRYLQIVEARDGWLSERAADAEDAPQHPLKAGKR